MPGKVIRVLQVGMSTNYGGTEAIVYEIYRYIDKSKIQFDFLNVYDEPLAKQEWLESMGARIYPLKLQRRQGYLKYLRGIKNFYHKHAQEYDVVICNVQCLDQIAMAKFAKNFGIKKTIVHLHNANYGVSPSKLARLAVWWNKKRCHKYVDIFMAVSSLAARWGYSKHDAKNAIILKHGIPVDTMSYSPLKRKTFRESFGYKPNIKVYGSAGRLDPQKNQAFLIDVYKAIAEETPEAEFVLLGKGPLERRVKELIDKSGIKSKIKLIPQVEDIGEFYSGIDVFLLPSLFEGLGLVLIEAQCSGLPCLVTKDTVPAETRISSAFQFLSLEKGPKTWAENAIGMECQNREFSYCDVLKCGRDIASTVRQYIGVIL